MRFSFSFLISFWAVIVTFFVLKPWPIISAFLGSLEPGWIGLDSGTGNGKYLTLPCYAVKDGQAQGSVWMIGLDRSRNLLEIAQHAGGDNTQGVRREVVLGDVLSECWRIGVFVSNIFDCSDCSRPLQSPFYTVRTMPYQ